ncbi:MAG: UPF0149 family protein [Desulfonatronovibrio sp.]
MKKNLYSFDKPLFEQELNELADFLDDIPHAMNLESMDGFLAAITCSPEIIMPIEFLDYIFGQDYEFEGAEQAEKYVGLILRHWTSIAGQLDNNDIFKPVLLEQDDRLIGNEWAVAFLFGVHLFEEYWKELLEDKEGSELFFAVFILAHENSPDPEMRPEPLNSEQRTDILDLLALSIPRIYAYFAENRATCAKGHVKSVTFERPVRKIGRNEPCPCKSGRKYKKCCGGN